MQPSYGAPAEPARATVLVVEDEESIAMLFRSTLEAEGYAVEHRGDGAGGLARLAEGGVDLLLLDQHLPDRLGTEVLAELHEQGEHPPVVMVTAHGDIEMAVAALKSGAMDYLIKDTELTFLSLLPRTVMSALERASLERRNRALVLELQRNEERLRNIFQRSPIGIMLLDKGGRVVSANSASAQLFGLMHPSELEGFRLIDALGVHDAFRALEGEQLDGTGASQERSLVVDFASLGPQRLPRMRASGEAHVELLLTRLAADGESRAVRAMAQLHDVSSRYDAETALARAQQQLDGFHDILRVLDGCRVLRKDPERWAKLETLLAGASWSEGEAKLSDGCDGSCGHVETAPPTQETDAPGEQPVA